MARYQPAFSVASVKSRNFPQVKNFVARMNYWIAQRQALCGSKTLALQHAWFKNSCMEIADSTTTHCILTS